jgi:stage III sporulation protein AA
MLEFLPQNIKDGLAHINLQHVYEIRLRANKPTTLNYQGKYQYLGRKGLTSIEELAIVCSFEDIENSVFLAGKCSVYSVENQIKQGFLTADGVRIGLAGEYVFENEKILAIRNFSSLCIRVPHEVINSGLKLYNICMSNIIYNLLIISPPGVGKTTILRDLSRILSVKTRKNILICDERGELSLGNIGNSCDVIKFSDKKTAFEVGIRTMRPDIIITDELSLLDCEPLQKAVSAGVKIFASAHFSDIRYVNKEFFQIFERFALLDSDEIGKIHHIYDGNGEEIY